VVVQDTTSDLYAAIDRATDRVSRTVARRLERYRNFTHHRVTAHRPVADEVGEPLY
jgi:ribosome-associated translation inhibitor RaiA